MFFAGKVVEPPNCIFPGGSTTYDKFLIVSMSMNKNFILFFIWRAPALFFQRTDNFTLTKKCQVPVVPFPQFPSPTTSPGGF